MKEKAVEKEIDHQRDIKNNLWSAFLISAAGTIGLTFSLDNSHKVLLFFLGILISSTLFFAYFKKDIYIDFLINKLEKGE